MSALTRKILYFFLGLVMLIDFYLIFNAGNPNSFLRLIIEDPSYDISITIALSIFIVLISMSMIRDNDQNSIKKILERNSQHITEQKKQNKSNEEIAESFLREMGSGKGLFHGFAKWRVMRYLSRM